MKCIAKAEGQPINISFETSRGDIIDFDSGLNKSDMKGVHDGDANEYDNYSNNNNNRTDIEIPYYHYPSEEHDDHRSVREDNNSEIENNNDDLQESYDSRVREDTTLSTGP